MTSRVRHAILQFQPLKGRRAANLKQFAGQLKELQDAGVQADVIVLPEAAFTGYFLQGGVRELAVTAEEFASELTAACAAYPKPVDVIAGFYERRGREYFNSALYLEVTETGSRVRHVHRKVFLPTYGVFDEDRFLTRGNRFEAFDTRFGRAALLVCEDAWHSISGTICALSGADVMYILNASPARGLEGTEPGNATYWRNVVRGLAGEHGTYVILSSLVGFEGGKGFTGTSLVAHPDGHVLAEAPSLEPAALIAEVNLDAIQAARYDNPLLADLRNTLPSVLPALTEALR
ncbi:MAG TPA: nitrilase-related carbon-nitrogen hydrolase [Deinococcales bacterium]|nr:nitrilase-related carbon-nitrogen hydrolase [Deinococcales bacterium]